MPVWIQIVGIIFAVGLFTGGVAGLTQYSSSFSKKKVNISSGNALMLTFFRSVGLTAIAGDGGAAITFSTSSLYMSGLADFKYAFTAILGAFLACTSSSFFVIINNQIFIFLLIGVGGLMAFSLRKSKSERVKSVALFLISLGLILYGIEQMKVYFGGLSGNPYAHKIIDSHPDSIILFLLYGTVLSTIVQASGTVVYFTISLYGANLLNVEQSLLIMCGSSFGSAFRARIYAQMFDGSGKRLMNMFAHMKLMSGICVTALYIAQIKTNVPLFNGISGLICNDLAFQYAFATTAIQCVLVLMLLPLAGTADAVYRKFYHDDSYELYTKSLYLRSIYSLPLNQWCGLIKKEWNRIIGVLSVMFRGYMRDRNHNKSECFYKAVSLTTDKMIDLCQESHDKETEAKAALQEEKMYERLLYTKKLNEELNEFLKILHQYRIEEYDENLLSIVAHLDFILKELALCASKGLEEGWLSVLINSIADAENRRAVIEEIFVSDEKYSSEFKLKIYMSYRDMMYYVRNILISYLERKSLVE